MHVIVNIVSILRTGDTAIVGNLHPSLGNNAYHTVHDIGLQLVGHFDLLELELSPASLKYAPHTCSDNYPSAQFLSSAPQVSLINAVCRLTGLVVLET
jgi:hypothetical protein